MAARDFSVGDPVPYGCLLLLDTGYPIFRLAVFVQIFPYFRCCKAPSAMPKVRAFTLNYSRSPVIGLRNWLNFN